MGGMRPTVSATKERTLFWARMDTTTITLTEGRWGENCLLVLGGLDVSVLCFGRGMKLTVPGWTGLGKGGGDGMEDIRLRVLGVSG